jgi:hypothetical protein
LSSSHVMVSFLAAKGKLAAFILNDKIDVKNIKKIHFIFEKIVIIIRIK